MINMKKTLIILLIWMATSCIYSLWAQASTQELAQKAYEKMENVAIEVIKQSFKPITHMKEESRLYLVTPGFFRVEDLGMGTTLKADNLQGITLGAGMGYVPTDRWLIYGIFSNFSARGTIKGEWVNSMPDIKADFSLDFQSLFLGGGYELIATPYLSLPVYGGVQLEHYRVDIGGISAPLIGDIPISGSGFLWGFSGGAALETRWKFLSVSPYYLYMYNMNGSEIGSLSYSYGLPAYHGGTMGLNIAIEKDSHWKFGATLANLIPGVTSKSLGSDFVSLVCFIAYQP